MAVGFNGKDFKVLLEDGYLPAPIPDERGYLSYTARIAVADTATLDALLADLSIITDIPAIGQVGGGMVVLEAGTSGTLTIPTGPSTERSYTAILTGLEQRYFLSSSFAEADATFRLIGEV